MAGDKPAAGLAGRAIAGNTSGANREIARKMNANYNNPVLRQLRDQQVRFAPRDQQLEQANRAERLLSEIEPARTYPYEYLCFRITDYRPTSFANTKLSGEQASHDLRLLVEDLTDAASVPVDKAGEEVLTVEELAKRF